MTDSPAGRELPTVEPARLGAAVRTVISKQTTDRLKAGADDSRVRMSLDERPENTEAAIYFQALLEVGYLVASADGLAPEERDALANLVEHATVSALDRETLRAHFEDLDQSTAVLGRRERLARVAADLETPTARDEALRFGAVVGIADGRLDPTEMAVLVELGEHFSMAQGQIDAVVGEVVSAITAQLEVSA